MFSRRLIRSPNVRHGSQIDPPNRFESVTAERVYDDLEWDQEYLNGIANRKIEYSEDSSRSIVSQNSSPDIPFRYSINPYRGCVHGCSYCYARNTHEYLGMNAGLDFETKIVVKKDAAKLFREFLCRPAFEADEVVFSGVTDCYQPIERELKLTRQCLEVAVEASLPIGIVTKNALVVRDIDLLQKLAEKKLAHVFLSINSLNPDLARDMEPRTSVPEARLRAIRELSDAGIPTGVMVSPVVPGLNDSDIPSVLEAARDSGAKTAGWILLRLPLTVEPVFLEWLQRTQPTKFEKVVGLIKQSRSGELNSAEFGKRMRGTGPIAAQIRNLFTVFARKYGLDRKLQPLDRSQFRPPTPPSGQLSLF